MAKKNKIFGLLLIVLAILIFCWRFTTEKINKKVEEVVIDEKISVNEGYFAILEIPEISLKKEIYETTDEENDVNKNILVHSNSIFPGNAKSTVILAGHSGTGKSAYFKNLYKLKLGDEIYLYYQNKKFVYEIKEIEEQEKTGTLYLKQSSDDLLILITCTYHNSNTQTIYYASVKNVQNIDKNG